MWRRLISSITRRRPKCRFCEALNHVHDDIHVVALDRDGNLTVGGRRPSGNALTELKSGVVLLRQGGVWKVISDSLKAQAVDIALRKSTDFDQVVAAKMMLHVVNEVERDIALIESAKEPSK